MQEEMVEWKDQLVSEDQLVPHASRSNLGGLEGQFRIQSNEGHDYITIKYLLMKEKKY